MSRFIRMSIVGGCIAVLFVAIMACSEEDRTEPTMLAARRSGPARPVRSCCVGASPLCAGSSVRPTLGVRCFGGGRAPRSDCPPPLPPWWSPPYAPAPPSAPAEASDREETGELRLPLRRGGRQRAVGRLPGVPPQLPGPLRPRRRRVGAVRHHGVGQGQSAGPQRTGMGLDGARNPVRRPHLRERETLFFPLAFSCARDRARTFRVYVEKDGVQYLDAERHRGEEWVVKLERETYGSSVCRSTPLPGRLHRQHGRRDRADQGDSALHFRAHRRSAVPPRSTLGMVTYRDRGDLTRTFDFNRDVRRFLRTIPWRRRLSGVGQRGAPHRRPSRPSLEAERCGPAGVPRGRRAGLQPGLRLRHRDDVGQPAQDIPDRVQRAG